MADEQKPETKPYRLRDGKQHFHDGQAVKPGDVVELTAAQVRAFGDKFLEVNAPPEVKPDAGIPQANPGVPQDIGAKVPSNGGIKQTGANEKKVEGEDGVLTPAGNKALGNKPDGTPKTGAELKDDAKKPAVTNDKA